MENLGYIKIGKEEINVLYRPIKYGVAIKIRKGGDKGRFLEDESEFLKDRPDLITDLIKGKVVNL